MVFTIQSVSESLTTLIRSVAVKGSIARIFFNLLNFDVNAFNLAPVPLPCLLASSHRQKRQETPSSLGVPRLLPIKLNQNLQGHAWNLDAALKL